MPPTFLLAQLHAETSLDRFAHSALPGAPVRPAVARRGRPAWSSSLRLRRTTTAAPALGTRQPTAA